MLCSGARGELKGGLRVFIQHPPARLRVCRAVPRCSSCCSQRCRRRERRRPCALQQCSSPHADSTHTMQRRREARAHLVQAMRAPQAEEAPGRLGREMPPTLPAHEGWIGRFQADGWIYCFDRSSCSSSSERRQRRPPTVGVDGDVGEGEEHVALLALRLGLGWVGLGWGGGHTGRCGRAAGTARCRQGRGVQRSGSSARSSSARARGCPALTPCTGEWLRPALMPITPQVSTAVGERQGIKLEQEAFDVSTAECVQLSCCPPPP